MTRKPVLLDEAMAEVRPLDVLEADIRLVSGDISKARLVLSPGEGLSEFDWVKVFAPNGDAMVCRVAAVETDYAAGMVTAELEHGLCVLRNAMLPDADILLDNFAEVVLGELLAYQTLADERGRPYWRVGTVEITDRLTMEAGSLCVLDGILRALSEYPEYALVTDQGVRPWTISILRLPDAPAAEGRLTRNVSTLKVAYTTENLCTRVYSARLPGGFMDSAAAGTWGVLCQHLPIPGDAEEESALTAARRYLANRSAPAVSIELEGAELSGATEEALDSFHAGTVMRLALPGSGVSLLHRITEVRYPEAFGDPEHVQVVLANRPQSVWLSLRRIERLAEETIREEKRTRSTSRSNAKSIRKHTEQILLKAEKEEVTALGTRLSQAEVNIDGANAQIALKASRTEVTDLRDRMSAAGIEVDGAIAQVKLLAKKAEFDKVEKRLKSAEASIEINAEGIASKVEVDGVISAINQSAEQVSIYASKINLDGYITVTELATERARITNLMNGSTTATTIKATNLYIGQSQNGKAYWHGEELRAYAVKDTGGTTRYVIGYTL